MGGWADGVRAKMLGVPDPATVWVEYKDSASSGLSTFLSVEEKPDGGGGDRVWAEMDRAGWVRLRDLVDEAIQAIDEDANPVKDDADADTH